ncbi:hypothetical protein F4818DRAFT_436525 [Hypoxylon cercidicola]|nr:hypothetical protein F4818DRAFT_436525 [Hypoxylon cercidicola]
MSFNPYIPSQYLSARPALQDASNRVNQAPVHPPPGLKAAAKSDTSLDDDIAAYKQNLDHISTEDMPIDLTCNQVRGKINRLLDSGIMKKGEFSKAIGCSPATVNTFLSKRGSMDGDGSCVYADAWG